jgi:hypothetical protein
MLLVAAQCFSSAVGILFNDAEDSVRTLLCVFEVGEFNRLFILAWLFSPTLGTLLVPRLGEAFGEVEANSESNDHANLSVFS